MADFSSGRYRAVLFDLDGTLVDTAPDMVRALTEMQVRYGVSPIDYETGRSQVSNGAIGLLRTGFPDRAIEFGDPLHHEFLALYESDLARESALFPGLDRLLERLESAAIPWGIVTNKPQVLTEKLLDALDLRHRSAATVCGDTLTARKPDPAPLLHATSLAGLDPASTIYVGDALRDIQAGQNAGMATIAARYGYITADDDAARWNADTIAADTDELAQIILKAVNLLA
jgi:phosphoglycolate phosphatase